MHETAVATIYWVVCWILGKLPFSDYRYETDSVIVIKFQKSKTHAITDTYCITLALHLRVNWSLSGQEGKTELLAAGGMVQTSKTDHFGCAQ